MDKILGVLPGVILTADLVASLKKLSSFRGDRSTQHADLSLIYNTKNLLPIYSTYTVFFFSADILMLVEKNFSCRKIIFLG